MPTIVNRVVRYTGGTDTTLAAAFAAIPADIRAGTGTDEQWNILIDESAAGIYEWDLGAYGPTLSGKLTSATNNIRIAANTGKSFKDNASKLTNALTYNAANGVALKATNVVLTCSVDFLVIEGLQFFRSVASAGTGEHGVKLTGSNVSVKHSIIKSNSTNMNPLYVIGGSNFVANTLVLTAGNGFGGESGPRLSNVTLVRTSGAGGNAINAFFSPPTVKNLAAFGFSAILGGDQTSFNVASSNNVTDLASGPTNWGAGSLLSRTFANQFQSITSGSEDFRVKTGSDLVAGTRDQTYTNDLDIVGSARSTTTPTIGAWEFPSVTYTYARPTSDITTQWSPSTGTDHYALIDETTANDADYIYATAAGQTDEVRLASMSAPQAGTDLLVNYRVQGIVGSASVTLSLVCNTTVHATDTTRTANGDYTLTVPSGTWASVADWTNMRLRFVSA
jgi:hypothetical protein